MTPSLDRFLARLLRNPRCKGYGVQSPFAYHIIRDVVRETWPYYAYAPLAGRYPERARERELHRFWLRLANYLQAADWVALNLGEADRAYLRAGCRRASFHDAHPHPSALWVDLACTGAEAARRFCALRATLTGEKAALVMAHIRHSKETLGLWDAVVADEATRVSFDLYDCGLAFFDRRMAKRNYKVMLPHTR